MDMLKLLSKMDSLDKVEKQPDQVMESVSPTAVAPVRVASSAQKELKAADRKTSFRDWVEEAEVNEVAPPPGSIPIPQITGGNTTAGANVTPTFLKITGQPDPTLDKLLKQAVKDKKIVSLGQGPQKQQPAQGQQTQQGQSTQQTGQQSREMTTETKIEESTKLNEKWDTKMKTAKKDMGKFKGWSIERLEKAKARLMKKKKRTEAEQKYVKQLNFAIRAKQKDKFGKIDESTLTKLEEGMNPAIKAAYHAGRSHALAREGYNCRYNEGTDEARHYHEGYKHGLDECYGQDRNMVVGEEWMEEEYDPVMDEAWMDEGAGVMHFKAQQAKKAGEDTFKLGGKTFPVKEENMDLQFESWTKQLNELLQEGLTVTTSTGQPGAQDSVSVSANGEDAAQLMQILQASGITTAGSIKKPGQASPMTNVPHDDRVQDAVSTRTMPAGMGMSTEPDYEQEVDVIKPYDYEQIIGALNDEDCGCDDEAAQAPSSASDMIGSLREKLLALEAKNPHEDTKGGGMKSPLMAVPLGKGMSQEPTEEQSTDPKETAAKAVDVEAVDAALAKDGKKAQPKVSKDAVNSKSVYEEKSSPALAMPLGKGMSQEANDKEREVPEPTSQEDIVDALAKDAKKETEADREFKSLKQLLDKQNLIGEKDKLKESQTVDPTSPNVVLAMPDGMGMSTEPTEEEREAPEAFDPDQVIDAIAKDAKKDLAADRDFAALKRLIQAHVDLGDKKSEKKETPSDKAKPDSESDFENTPEKAEEKQDAADRAETQQEKEDQKKDRVEEGKMKCKHCGEQMKEGHKCDTEKLEEWSNSFRNKDSKDKSESKEEQFETSDKYMTDDMSGGLNGKKRDQTTLPHTEVKIREDKDSLRYWLKLSGLR